MCVEGCWGGEKREGRAGVRERGGIVTVFDLSLLLVCTDTVIMHEEGSLGVSKGDLGTRRRSQPTVHIRISGKSFKNS